jgi:hypothetical protein
MVSFEKAIGSLGSDMANNYVSNMQLPFSAKKDSPVNLQNKKIAKVFSKTAPDGAYLCSPTSPTSP